MIPAQPVEALRYYSLVALGVVLVAGLWVLMSAKHGTAASISERLSKNRAQFVVMALFLTLFGLVFYSSVYFWVGPTYHAPLLFYVIASVAYVAQLVLAWVPYAGKTAQHTQLHTHCGEFVASSMAVCLALLFAASSASLPVYSYWLSLLSIGFSAVTIVLYVGVPKIQKHFVIYESVYILLFMAAITALVLKV